MRNNLNISYGNLSFKSKMAQKKGLEQSAFELHEGQSRMMNEMEQILTNLIERITRNAKKP